MTDFKTKLAEFDAMRAAAEEDTFTFGKYRGETHNEIAATDPGYVVWAFENVKDHAGIKPALYRACQIDERELDEDDPLEQMARDIAEGWDK